MTSERIDSTRAPEPVGAFPHARRAGNLLFLSGIGPRVRGSKEIPGVTLDDEGNILNTPEFEKVILTSWEAGDIVHAVNLADIGW